MIYARHAGWAELVFRFYIDRLMKKHFHAVYLSGSNQAISTNHPLLIVANHSTWWDGFFLHLLNRKLFFRRFHVMMLESQLQVNNFFARIGAYSIDPESTRGTLSSLRYTLSLLNGPAAPDHLVCMFPEGKLVANIAPRPDWLGGLDWILGRIRNPVDILPVAIRVEMLEEQRPEAMLRFGKVVTIKPGELPESSVIRHVLADNYAQLEKDIISKKEMHVLLRGRESINVRFERLRNSLGLEPDTGDRTT